MGIILFIAIVLLLIISHEFGHFVVAKLVGMRVDEFGIGFPPRLWGKKIGETIYSINWLPFGGFVSIFGENYETAIAGRDAVPHDPQSFIARPKWAQALVLVAGVAMNWLVAAVIIIAGFVYGLPVPASGVPQGTQLIEGRLLVTQVAPASAAEGAGIVPGDRVLYVVAGNESVQGDPIMPEELSQFIASHSRDAITFGLENIEGVRRTTTFTPAPLYDERPVAGITMDVIGTAKLPFFSAISWGLKTTAELTVAIVYGFSGLLGDLVQGRADLSAVSGPVGLVSLVGSASQIGMIYVLTLAAIISLNLAVLNLIPFPALDGGRLLFVLIEAIKGSPISPRIANRLNLAGFTALILLMVAITISDIIKL